MPPPPPPPILLNHIVWMDVDIMWSCEFLERFEKERRWWFLMGYLQHKIINIKCGWNACMFKKKKKACTNLPTHGKPIAHETTQSRWRRARALIFKSPNIEHKQFTTCKGDFYVPGFVLPLEFCTQSTSPLDKTVHHDPTCVCPVKGRLLRAWLCPPSWILHTIYKSLG